METVYLSWNLYKSEQEENIEKYCHNCSKKTLFRDTFVRRHNANGKNIYKFAIYKCLKDHTWNKKIAGGREDTLKEDPVIQKDTKVFKLETVELKALADMDVQRVVITMEQVVGKWRLDKILSQQILDLSRTQIVKAMKDGHILLNNHMAKPSMQLQRNQKLSILLNLDSFK